ncbi:hypothetical protein CRUP_005480 [Coryphaenoides rupestris]|nr:hypothetical protein CRUP_005480 [Coryphaenoides rupestris]
MHFLKAHSNRFSLVWPTVRLSTATDTRREEQEQQVERYNVFNMRSPFAFMRPIEELFDGKVQQFMSGIADVHMVWVHEIQEEAKRMLTSDFSAEPELMPKTPSQKKRSRRKRVSLGYQEETRAKRRLSRTKGSKSRRSSVKLTLIMEDECIQQASTSGEVTEQPKPSTPLSNIPQPGVSVEAAAASDSLGSPVVPARVSSTDHSSAEPVAEPEDSPGRHATKIAIAGTTGRAERSSVRHSLKLRYSLAGLRHSIRQDALRRGSRRSIRTKSSARTGNSTFSSKVSDDSCMEADGEAENNGDLPSVASDAVDMVVEESEATSKAVDIVRITRSMAINSPLVVSTPVRTSKLRDISSGSARKAVGNQRSRRSSSSKRRSPDVQEVGPTKKPAPSKKSHSVVKPNMRSFLQTVQKNRMLMMTPSSLSRSTVMKSFIKHTTPLKVDTKSRELLKLEALKKKQEQEEERLKKMEEEKRLKQEEQKRKRDERLRRVVDTRMKEDEEKKKRIEQKMTQLEEKNDKMRVERLAEEKAKKAAKRQEEADQKRRLEEEARLKKIQQAEEEEEKRQQELVAKRAAEEEEQRARKLAEARRALELRREQERERERQAATERERVERENALAVQRELERERQAATERERAERQKALAVQRELEKAAREKERRELEERRQLEENRMREERHRLAAEKAARDMEAAKQKMALYNNVQSSALKTPVGKCAALNITMEVEKSPQSYNITPKGGNKPLIKGKSADDYGMDQNSDDSTDDESAPRKPIPSWAEGHNLQQVIMKQYFNPPDLHTYFGRIEPPKLEKIFSKSKPRFFKRTSSAVWHSPPRLGQH